MNYFEKAEIKRTSYKMLWALPFAGFIIGYWLVGYFLGLSDLLTPNVIGKSLDQGVVLLSQNSLGVRILAQREDHTMPEGFILDQLPSPLQKIKPNQNVFVTVSTRQKSSKAPDFWGKKYKEVSVELAKKGFEATVVRVHGDYPQGMCVAQFPAAGYDLDDKKMILYVSEGTHNLGIMPSIKGLALKGVQEAYKALDARIEIFHTSAVPDDHVCSECIIADQQPLPGAVIDTARGLRIQVAVSQS